MGITPSPACTQKGVQSQGSCSHCPSLCSRSSCPGGKDLSLSRTEKTVKEQLVLALVPSHQTAAHYRHFGGERWVDFSSLDDLQGGTGAGKDTELQALKPAEKRTNSWVLVLEFSQAPQAPCACLRPWTLAPSCPAACSASQQIPSPQGLVLLA